MSKIYSNSFFTTTKNSPATKEKPTATSKDLQMVSMYTELAQIDGQYRFDEKDIAKITKNFKYHVTRHSIIDLYKSLLEIGVAAKNPLSADEIVGFLNATNNKKLIEQKNVLDFLKVAKEKEAIKITPQYLRETYPYEKFKQKELDSQQKLYNKTPDSLDEKVIKERYETAIHNQFIIMSNPNYRTAIAENKCPISEYVTKNNKDAVNAIAKCIDPKKYFSIVEKTGMTTTVMAAANSLICAYNLSDGSNELVMDLARAFYPAEIKQIADTLLAKAKSNNKTVLPELKDYVPKTYKIYDTTTGCTSIPNLSTQRKKVLKALGLEDQIKLLPLRKYVDVYSNSPLDMRGKNITAGNYERGKKK